MFNLNYLLKTAQTNTQYAIDAFVIDPDAKEFATTLNQLHYDTAIAVVDAVSSFKKAKSV